MARENSVAYRLKAVGDSEIIDSFRKIAEEGDKSAKRIVGAYDRDMKTVEASIASLEQRVARVGNIPIKDARGAINSATGIQRDESGQYKSAAASAEIFNNELAKMEQRKNALLNQYSPIFGAQLRFNQSIEQATELLRRDIITQEEFNTVKARAGQVLAETRNAVEGGSVSIRQQRAAYQQLGFQVQDITQQLALGINPLVVLAQQGGQTASALQLGLGEGGKAGQVARFIAGPWGSLILAGVTVLGLLVMKSLEQEKASWKLGDALDFQKMSHAELTKAIREQKDAADAAIKSSAAAEIQAVKNRQANIKEAISLKEKTKAMLEAAQASQKIQLSDGSGATGAKAGLGALSGIYAADIARQEGYIASLYDNLRRDQVKVSISEAAAASDKGTGIRRKYELAQDQLIEEAKTNSKTAAKLTEILTALYKARDEELQQLQESNRKAKKAPKPDNSLSTAVGSNLNADALRFLGRNENIAGDNRILRGFFKEAGVNIDPKITAWCAAFVNAVLATNGLPGTGSLSARSFLDYGSNVNNPNKGDIVVLRRGNNAAQGHVGFFDGFDKNGNPILISGNAGGGQAVTRQSYSKNDVLGYRRVGAPGEMLLQAEQAAAKAEEERVRMREALLGLVNEELAAQEALLAKIKEINEAEAKGALSPQEAGDARMNARAGAFMPGLIDSLRGGVDAETRSGEFMSKWRTDYDDRMQLLSAEKILIRATAEEREKELQWLEIIQDLRRGGVTLSADELAEIRAGNDELIEREELLKQQADAWNEVYRIGENMIDTILDPANWEDFGDLAKSVLDDIAKEMLKLALINPLKNLLLGGDGSGGLLPTLGSIFTGGIGGNAIGTERFGGGWTRLNENGKEALFLPGMNVAWLPEGSKVFNASRTRRMAQNDNRPVVNMPINIDATGADAAGLARVEAQIYALRQELPGQVVQIVGDAQSRFALPGGR